MSVDQIESTWQTYIGEGYAVRAIYVAKAQIEGILGGCGAIATYEGLSLTQDKRGYP